LERSAINQKKKSGRSAMQSEEARDKYNAIRRGQGEIQCNQKKPERSANNQTKPGRSTMQSEEVKEKCNQKKPERNAINQKNSAGRSAINKKNNQTTKKIKERKTIKEEEPTYQQREDQPKRIINQSKSHEKPPQKITFTPCPKEILPE
ncbi:hypothetical protein L195_g058862, partial [Trifolium pratense]